MKAQTERAGRRKLLQLFLSTLYISAFTFGGGFVIVTFMKRKFVDELHSLIFLTLVRYLFANVLSI